jgi:hypothetical protein
MDKIDIVNKKWTVKGADGPLDLANVDNTILAVINGVCWVWNLEGRILRYHRGTSLVRLNADYYNLVEYVEPKKTHIDPTRRYKMANGTEVSSLFVAKDGVHGLITLLDGATVSQKTWDFYGEAPIKSDDLILVEDDLPTPTLPQKTLRDEFAMAALNVLFPKDFLSIGNGADLKRKTFARIISARAYDIADAMLAERDRKP